MKNYVLTERAQEDIQEILQFVLQRSESPRNAALVVLEYLHAAMEDVGTNPKLGN